MLVSAHNPAAEHGPVTTAIYLNTIHLNVLATQFESVSALLMLSGQLAVESGHGGFHSVDLVWRGPVNKPCDGVFLSPIAPRT